MSTKFLVECELPEGVTPHAFAEWAEETLRGAPGGYPKEDPIFHLRRGALRVLVEMVPAPKLTGAQIEALGDYFSGPAVADASIRLSIASESKGDNTIDKLNRLGGKCAEQFFKVRRVFGLEGVPHNRNAIVEHLRKGAI